MAKRFQGMSFKNRLTLCFGTTLLVGMVFISLHFLIRTNAQIRRSTIDSAGAVLTQVQQGVDAAVQGYERGLRLVSMDTSLQNYLGREQTDIYEIFSAKQHIRTFLNQIIVSVGGMPDIIVYTHNETLYSSKGAIQDISSTQDGEIYPVVMADDAMRVFWFGPRLGETAYSYSEKKVLTGAVRLNWLLNTRPIGMCLLNVEPRKLFGSVENLSFGENGFIAIVDPDGIPLRQGLLPDGFVFRQEDLAGGFRAIDIGGVPCMVVSRDLDFLGYSAVCVVPESDMNSLRISSLLGSVLISLGTMLVGSTLVYFLSVLLTRPINTVVRGMEQLSRGDMDARIVLRDKSEMALMAEAFNSMAHSLKTLMEENTRSLLEQHRLELTALQAKIDPHFLYNTLSTVNTMALDIEAYDISEALTSVAKYYKMMLNQGRDNISIAEELNFAQSYLRLQQLRMGTALSFSLESDASIRRCLIPKLTLQPFIENAVMHGSAGQDQPLHVEVLARSVEGRVRLTVRDNGAGMDPAVAAALLSADAPGYGIKNVLQRLRLFYRGDMDVHIRSGPGEGCEIRIDIPETGGKEIV